MSEYKLKPLSFILLPEGEPMFSEMATVVTIDDEAAGPFLVISQENGSVDRNGKVSLSWEELEIVNRAAEQLREVWEEK